MSPDLDIEQILRLHGEAQNQGKDLYTFLSGKFPELSVEGRLQYLAAILNDYLEEYRWEDDDELRADGYLVKRFYPKKEKNDAP